MSEHELVAEKPQYWKRRCRHGVQYAVMQLHFPSRAAGLAWVERHHPDEMAEAEAGWSDDAPSFDHNIWADPVPETSPPPTVSEERQTFVIPDGFRIKKDADGRALGIEPIPAPAVAVKPLEWREAAWRGGGRMIPYRWTGSVAGTGIYYAVRRDEGVPDLFIVSGWAGVGTNPYHTLEAAKAAAQADYEARIRSALLPASASEAVDVRKEWWTEILRLVQYHVTDDDDRTTLMAAIRALKGAAK